MYFLLFGLFIFVLFGLLIFVLFILDVVYRIFFLNSNFKIPIGDYSIIIKYNWRSEIFIRI
jgi:hypothetical protein